jgi:ABC-type maltose transport system permease subunit
VLSSAKLLEKVEVPTKGIPDKIGSYPINDPEGLYRGQALAGYGLMWNTRYMQAHKAADAQGVGRPDEAGLLRPPRDLGAVALGHDPPHLRDHPAGRGLGQRLEPDPADRRQLRRGHRAQLRRARRRAERPVRHRPGDRLLRPRRQGLGLPVEFVYPSMTAIVPANIAAVAGSKSPEAPSASCSSRSRKKARAAARSEDLAPAGLPTTYAKAPLGYPNPFSGTIQAKVNFDTALSESRYYVVSSLFDQVITFRHKELQAATKAIQDAEKRLGGPCQRAARRSEEARLDAARARRARPRTRSCSPSSRRRKGDDAALRKKTQIEEEWSSKAKANYARAVELATPRNDRRRGRPGDRGFLAVFLAAPVASVFHAAFSSGGGGFTLAHFESFLQISLMRESFWNSLYVAGLSVLFASLIAVPLAYFTVRFRFRGAL